MSKQERVGFEMKTSSGLELNVSVTEAGSVVLTIDKVLGMYLSDEDASRLAALLKGAAREARR